MDTKQNVISLTHQDITVATTTNNNSNNSNNNNNNNVTVEVSTVAATTTTTSGDNNMYVITVRPTEGETSASGDGVSSHDEAMVHEDAR